jgi:hypothetical protein
MVSGILLIVISVVLASFWFRYSCLRLLHGRTEPDARAIRERLASEHHLEPVRQSLDRDYRVVAYLLEHSRAGQGSLEHRLLLWDYRALNWWYRITRTTAPGQARQALLEMASIVGALAAYMGRHAGVRTGA